ncbi:MAG: response regulator, partial [Verrucomicrobiota bacterium]|nr:response regulator [Verrucomicrobiota bacterium]
TDPRETLAVVEEFQPDLIMLDMNMPHLSGADVLEQLKQVIPKEDFLPVLVLTADTSAPTKRKALQAGASEFLGKPFDSSELFLRLNNLLARRSLHRQLQSQKHGLEQKVSERTGELERALADLKSAQNQVVQQERLHAFAEMAGGVAHDFNNALMPILGYSELLLNSPHGLDNKDQVRQYLKIISTAGNDAAQVVSRLRNFYRPRENDDLFSLVDLNDLVEQAVALTQPKWRDQALAQGRTISVETDLAKIPKISGNPGELREALMNLLFNAVDAMPRGGTITLYTATAENGVVLELRDTGIGMDETVRAKCLEPFFTTKGEQGTGLGLSMVFGIIRRHEGTIDIQSEPGKGTTFHILIPVGGASSAVVPIEAVGVERPLRILVVDDEPRTREVVTRYLDADGHDVVAAGSGMQALDLVAGHRFDLLVTDQAMPGMTGEQFALQIERLYGAGQPIIMLTGFADALRESGERPAAVKLILSKPVSPTELRSAVGKVMAEAAS